MAKMELINIELTHIKNQHSTLSATFFLPITDTAFEYLEIIHSQLTPREGMLVAFSFVDNKLSVTCGFPNSTLIGFLTWLYANTTEGLS